MPSWRQIQQQHARENDGKHLIYDDRHWTAQVCVAGHVQNGGIRVIRDEKYCGECGAELIHQCPSCNNNIKGAFRSNGFSIDKPPAFCQKYGKPYPWTEVALKNIRQVIRDSDLPESDKQEASNDAEAILRNVPGAEAAAHRTRHRLEKMGELARVTYESYIVPLAAETLARMLKGD